MIPVYIYIISLVLLSLYFVLNTSIVWGWFRLPKSNVSRGQAISFSILIAMRNEDKNILNIINNIKSQNYNTNNYEIIVIDDHSTDQSYERVNDLNLNNLTLIRNLGEGKKSAIKTGLQEVKNKYIIQTDADCTIGDNWLSSIRQYLENNDVKLLIAPLVYDASPSFFAQLQELEAYALNISTAGLCSVRRPVMANGANLIYPKSILRDDFGFNQKTASGDDIFLLHYVKQEYGVSAVHYLKSRAASVKTKPIIHLKPFINQRIRWASKGKYYKDTDSLIVGSLIMLINIILAMSFVGSFFSKELLYLFGVLFISKMLADYILIIPILAFYSRIHLLIYFPILSFVYPFYISFVALVSPFVRFDWKGRKYD